MSVSLSDAELRTWSVVRPSVFPGGQNFTVQEHPQLLHQRCGDDRSYPCVIETTDEANGGSHVPGEVVYANQKPECEAQMNAFYSFSGWHTDAGLTVPLDLESATFTDTLGSFTLADLAVGNTVQEKSMQATRLYAKWVPDTARRSQ